MVFLISSLVLEFEHEYIQRLPIAQAYERSYSHVGFVTHTVVTPDTQFIVTADSFGHLKFWKKSDQGIEFVKRYRPHLEAITGLSCSGDGRQLCSVGKDRSLKFYDVVAFDVLFSIELEGFNPSCCEFIHHRDSPLSVVAIGDQDSELIRLYKGWQKSPIKVIALHSAPVHIIRRNPAMPGVVSVDIEGQIEVWDVPTLETKPLSGDDDIDDVIPGSQITASEEEDDIPPLPNTVEFQLKAETDLFDFMKSKAAGTDLLVTSVEFSSDGEYFVTHSTDMQVRLFHYRSCKRIIVFDESIKAFEATQSSDSSIFHVDPIDFGRRVAVEKALIKAIEEDPFRESTPPINAIFDDSGNFLIYPTMLGVKVVNLQNFELRLLLGKVDNQLRLLNVQLFQGLQKKITGSASASISADRFLAQTSMEENPKLKEIAEDPILFCSAFKRQQFFLYSRREPDEKYSERFHLLNSLFC